MSNYLRSLIDLHVFDQDTKYDHILFDGDDLEVDRYIIIHAWANSSNYVGGTTIDTSPLSAGSGYTGELAVVVVHNLGPGMAKLITGAAESPSMEAIPPGATSIFWGHPVRENVRIVTNSAGSLDAIVLVAKIAGTGEEPS